MSRSDEKGDLIRAVFDALPSIVLVVDRDVRIQDCNQAAASLFAVDRAAAIQCRAGEAFRCVHSSEHFEGCGRAPSCKTCVIRTAIGEAFTGSRVVRRRARIELGVSGQSVEIFALVTATPVDFENRPLVLLVIEDLKDISELQSLMSICAVCRKIRADENTWVALESYFKKNWDVDFSHCYCPDCHQNEVEKIKLYTAPGKENKMGSLVDRLTEKFRHTNRPVKKN